jgi:2-oxoglutarate dehydrogenase E1 component
MFVDWTPYLGHDYTDIWDTTFDIDRLKELGLKMNTYQKVLYCNVKFKSD